MIAPRGDVDIRSERPRMKVACYVRLCGRLFRRFITSWRERNRSRLQDKVISLVNSTSLCKTRKELEELLGTPKYAMPSAFYGTNPVQSDREQKANVAEYYEVDQVAVDLVFKDGKVWRTFGYVKLSHWDVVCLDQPYEYRSAN